MGTGKQPPSLLMPTKLMRSLIRFLLAVLACSMCECQSPLMGKYLYTASIQYRFNESYCTGAIVSEIFVLTTCDCVSTYNEDKKIWVDRPPYRMIVAVGIYDLFTDMRAGQLRMGKAIRKHQRSKLDVKDRQWTNLAIIEVNKPFLFEDFNANVASPMEVFAPWQSFKLKSLLIFMSNSPPKDCYAVGWGFTVDNTSVPSSIMQEIPLTLKRKCNFNNCTTGYCKSNYTVQPNICGQIGNHRCGGFRGNLLVCFGKVYGLVSVPSLCPKKGSLVKTPTVFVRLDEGLAFIHGAVAGRISKGSSVSPPKFQFFILSVLIMMHFKRSRILAGQCKHYIST